MKTIWKYEVKLMDGPQKIDMPIDAIIKKVEGGFFWAIVDTEKEMEERIFFVHGTGHEITDRHCKYYVGTWFAGPFVWHLFELD
jgi:hypothetical protein